ncbi:uncharacterized protein SPAPADRAFT_145188 [Spathaspora passalidarum NRRL Y-27907]|uniref:Origin recognition complex subunit 1 n=1 Tax=Spathaspora passalidarum (strain NRRL Y-27907 / 11-Y1) TaxID=619300 RepID=G3AEJ7_SPAPN|nr:uncharacterized protein SPAPADRAFT_145188 [Spathaspora passalidarum NRRL Y-27907]EGW34758.1 hypothetical protein SPAPADRAFT_145188 [Spathaspora passalidarum NRRL Y-27907]
MARSQKDLKGWQYILSEDNANPETPNRRSRRSARNTSSIILKRDNDDMELKVGDTVLVKDDNAVAEVALIKSIDFGTDYFIEVLVIWFTHADSKEPDVEQNEIYITPYLEKIQMKDVIMKVQVLSNEEYNDIVIDESNSSTTFMTRRACYDDGKSDSFDFRFLMDKFTENPDGFVQYLRTKTVVPTKKRKTSKNSSARASPAPVETIISKETSSVEAEAEAELETAEQDEEDEDEEEEEEEILDKDNDVDFEDLTGENSDDDVIGIDSSDDEYVDALQSPVKRSRGTPSARSSPVKSPRKSSKTTTPKSSPKKQQKNQIEELYSTILTPTKRRRVFKPNTPILPTLLSPSKNTNALTDPTSQAFKDIKAKLHTSQKLNALPGREDEYAMIYMNLESAVNEETGCCVYVSGVPGMGKTATIRDVIEQMTQSVERNEIKPFNYLELNGLKLVSPNVAYEMLWEQISGDKVSPASSALLLEEYFNREDNNRKPFIVLMDELDQIATKKQNVMYNFLNWPTYKNSKLIVIAVANTMDLPERVLSNKISSRLGLRRIQFRGYTFDQLGDIIRHRLDMLTKQSKRKVHISPDAIGFASRKVASVSGDARRALTICRRAVEIAEKEYSQEKNGNDDDDKPYQVQISHISAAINETVNSPLSQYLASLPYASKLLLAAVLLRSKRTGLAENTLGDIIDEMKNAQYKSNDTEITDILYADNLFDTSISKKGSRNLRVPYFKYILNSFVESGILIQQNVQGERQRLIQLNVPEEEVISVFKRDKQVSHLVN